MGGDTPVYNAKIILEVPLGLTFLTRTMESRQKCNPTFRRDNFFSIILLVHNFDKSVSTQRFFPKKRKNKSTFQIVNLCNGRTKDFVELWEIIHLKI